MRLSPVVSELVAEDSVMFSEDFCVHITTLLDICMELTPSMLDGIKVSEKVIWILIKRDASEPRDR